MPGITLPSRLGSRGPFPTLISTATTAFLDDPFCSYALISNASSGDVANPRLKAGDEVERRRGRARRRRRARVAGGESVFLSLSCGDQKRMRLMGRMLEHPFPLSLFPPFLPCYSRGRFQKHSCPREQFPPISLLLLLRFAVVLLSPFWLPREECAVRRKLFVARPIFCRPFLPAPLFPPVGNARYATLNPGEVS